MMLSRETHSAWICRRRCGTV